MALDVTKQSNIAVNPARKLAFFEGQNLCYNYGTGQWSRIPAYAGLGYYSVNDKDYDIGLVIYSSGSVDLQNQFTTGPSPDATITTGAVDLNEGGRTVVTGVRPLINGGTTTVKVGVQDSIGGTVSWSSATTPNSRTKLANVRSEGKYIRAEFTITGGFTTALGMDVDFTPRGRV